jgi:hypothetical protein
MNHHPRDDDKGRSSDQPGEITDGYIFDESSGLYTKKSADPSHKPRHTRQSHVPLPVDVRRDWVDYVAIVIEVITLVGLALTVYYAGKQWKESHEQFLVDERAWIAIDSVKVKRATPPAGVIKAWSFIYDIYPKNVGKTVARHVVVRAATVGSGPPSPGSDRAAQLFQDGLFKDQGSGNPVVLPTVLAATLAPNSTSLAPFVMKAVEPNNGMWRYLVGRIDYDDAFGGKRWLKFCLIVANGAGDVKACGCCNDSDDNPFPKEPRRQPVTP